jgi:hypothetical protein
MSSLRWTDADYQAHIAKLCKLAKGDNVKTHTVATPDDTTRPKLPEKDVLRGCLDLLSKHPKVAFYWRQNSGMASYGDRAVRFSFKGCSDILAVLKGTGKLLAIECKATGRKPSDDQRAFLDRVRAAGGVGVCIDDPADLAKFLGFMA